MNPDHLYIGTQSDNMLDKVRRGRGNFALGERHGKAVLTADDVLAIRAAGGSASQKLIARDYGVSQTLVSQILRRRIWTHL